MSFASDPTTRQADKWRMFCAFYMKNISPFVYTRRHNYKTMVILLKKMFLIQGEILLYLFFKLLQIELTFAILLVL